eukprot:s99_g31.t1
MATCTLCFKEKIKAALPELQTIFTSLDADGSGHVTRAEAANVPLTVFPPKVLEAVSVDSMADLFEMLDVDEGGTLTQAEFLEGLLHLLLLDVPMWAIQMLKLLRPLRKNTIQVAKDLDDLKQFLGYRADLVNKMIQEKKLQPIIRTSYYRCAFQLATDNKEYVPNGHPNKPWCLVGTDTLQRDDIYRFPYAILEIKLQDVSEAPLWLRQTLNDIGAIQVHKFSKFQHAMAFLHPQRKGNASALLKSDTVIDDLAVPNISKIVAPHGEGHFLKDLEPDPDMDNLDPKAVFANERTLLHYAEKGMYVAAVAVIVLHQGGRYKILGGSLSVMTAVYYVWILVAYFQRLDEIKGRSKVVKNREARLDWNLGPVLATTMVSIVLVYTLSKGWLGLLRSEHEHG